MTRARVEKPYQRPPGSRRFAGNARLERRRLHRLEQAELLGAPQAAGVDGDQHVGRAALAFVADALDQRVFAALDAVDLDAGGFGEVGVERLVGLVVARRVEVQDLVLRGAEPASSAASGKRNVL